MRSESWSVFGMIFRRPGTNRGVVVAARHGIGLSNLDNIGGITEETHYYLVTGHFDALFLGAAIAQALPLGPRVCTDYRLGSGLMRD